MSMAQSHAQNEQASDPRCSTVLIAGFLGAGKTTLLRNILGWPGDLSKTAVLVNEFGKIGIDGELLKGFTNPVYELTNGCICCTIQADLIRALEEILDRFHPTRLLIEATGVADPIEIAGFLKSPRIKGRLSALKTITVLSGDFWEGRDYFGPLYFNQIKAADLLLFNKVDLLPKEDVPRLLQEIREINQSCALMPTLHCDVDPATLWAPVVEGDKGTLEHDDHDHPDHKDAEALGFLTFAFEEATAFSGECFRRFVRELPINLYRVKGFALLDDRRFFLNHVGGRTEWLEVVEPGNTRLAFVGWDIQEEQVLKALKVCLKPAHD